MTFLPQPHEQCFWLPTITGGGELWAVYQVIVRWNDDPAILPETIFIDCCKLNAIFGFARAQQNTDFLAIARSGIGCALNILHITEDKNEANRETFKLVKQLNPRCNLRGYNLAGNTGRPIMCSNGQTYANQSEAALSLGLSQGAISRHMKGELKHVKHFRFEYVIAADAVNR